MAHPDNDVTPDRQPHDHVEGVTHRRWSWVLLLTVVIVAVVIIALIWGVFYHSAG